MTRILVIDDDLPTRMMICASLRHQGYDVLEGVDGHDGLSKALLDRPDLVISDVQMPKMDGFTFVSQFRQIPRMSNTPVILLTSLQDRADVRMGMRAGADDYLIKPFDPLELQDAVKAQLGKAAMQARLRSMAVDKAVKTARENFQPTVGALQALAVSRDDADSRWATLDMLPETGEHYDAATVLYADIRDYAGWTAKLNPEEMTDLVKQFYQNIGDTVYLFGATCMQFIGEGLIAVFSGDKDTMSMTHGLRGLRAAMGLADSAGRVRDYALSRYAARGIPMFDTGIVLHSGPVSVARLKAPMGGGAQAVPVGETVTTGMAIHRAAQTLGWTVTASITMQRQVSGAARMGRRGLLTVPGRGAPVDVCELTGLQA
jgi:DNA-binding response OmpR family regulator